MPSVEWNSRRIHSQSGDNTARKSIILVAIGNVSDPSRRSCRNGCQAVVSVGSPRKGISNRVITTFLINELGLKAKQLREHLLLPGCVKPLFIEVDETLLIGEDHKLSQLQVQTPVIHSKENSKIFFLIGAQTPRVLGPRALLIWLKGGLVVTTQHQYPSWMHQFPSKMFE